jgi:uncharacterized protein
VTETVLVKVKPGSRKGPLVETGEGGELTIYVREWAVDGRRTAPSSRFSPSILAFRAAD